MTTVTLGRGLKVGAAGWAAGLVATMLVGTLVVRGIGGAVIASFPGAVAFYLNAHGFLVWRTVRDADLGTATEAVGGPPGIAALTAVPVAVLLLAGAYVGRHVPGRAGAVGVGVSLTVGYAAMTALGLLLVLNSPFVGADGSLLAGDLLVRVLGSGVVAPLVLGTAGARVAGWRAAGSGS